MEPVAGILICWGNDYIRTVKKKFPKRLAKNLAIKKRDSISTYFPPDKHEMQPVGLIKYCAIMKTPHMRQKNILPFLLLTFSLTYPRKGIEISKAIPFAMPE